MRKKIKLVTIGIVTADRYPMLLSLLRSLATIDHVTAHKTEIIVLDNSVNDGPVSSREWNAMLTVLTLCGFTVRYTKILHGYNIYQLRQMILDMCESRYLWFLDDDCIIVRDPLAIMLGAMQYMNDSYGFVQGAVIDCDNTEGFSDWSIQKDKLVEIGGTPCWYYWYKESYRIPIIKMTNANVLINVRIAKDVGGYIYKGERVFEAYRGNADTYLGAKLASVSQCLFTSDARVFHYPAEKRNFVRDFSWMFPILEDGCSKKVVEALYAYHKAKHGSNGSI